jgi:hypothetical protein
METAFEPHPNKRRLAKIVSLATAIGLVGVVAEILYPRDSCSELTYKLIGKNTINAQPNVINFTGGSYEVAVDFGDGHQSVEIDDPSNGVTSGTLIHQYTHNGPYEMKATVLNQPSFLINEPCTDTVKFGS